MLRTDELAWRELVTAALDPSTSASVMLQRVKATAGKVIPSTVHRDQAAFVALQALARASALGDAARRRRLSGCLKGVASECARTAGWATSSKEPEVAEAGSWVAQDLFAHQPSTV